MIVARSKTNAHNVPKFSQKRCDDPLKSQPIIVRKQGPEFIAIVQRDGGNEETHWVLVEIGDAVKMAKRSLKLAKEG